MARARGLDFFIHCEIVCQKVRRHVACSARETAMRSLQRSVLRDLDFMHDLPLLTLNDRLKKYPCVDPLPFDQLLSEMIDAVLEWLECITRSDWIVEVAHQISTQLGLGAQTGAAFADARSSGGTGSGPTGRAGGAGGARPSRAPVDGDRSSKEAPRGLSMNRGLDLEPMGRFIYPMPLKLRELQEMIRPFMEVRSAHHIVGLDAIIVELVRSLLRLFHTVKAWDEALMEHVERIADAVQNHDLDDSGDSSKDRHTAILELCAAAEFDVFEASHRLHHINSDIFPIAAGEIDTICQKLPLFQDQRVLRGPPTNMLDHGGLMSCRGDAEGRLFGNSDDASGLKAIRLEAMSWWHESRFSHAAPSRIFATTLLTYLVDLKLHPDPWIAEMLPRVLERLFGVQISCHAFMNRLLPKLGGYVDAGGTEVPEGHGFPVKSDPPRCAETIIFFLRQWSDLVLAAEEEERQVDHPSRSRSGVKRGSLFCLDAFLRGIQQTGHSAEDVLNLFEGAKKIPDHVLQVPVEEGDERYRIDESLLRRWELLTDQCFDLEGVSEKDQRDLGPYIHLQLDQPEQLALIWHNQPKEAWCLMNPNIIKKAAQKFVMDDDSSLTSDEDNEEVLAGDPAADLSASFGLRLVEWPRELGAGPECTSSTFIRFFSEEGRFISRSSLQGLPRLPWTFGSDDRNTIIVDLPGPGIAPFHCIFDKCRLKDNRVRIIPLGDPMAFSYIVCPKYQPLQVRNGDRILCHQWAFELRIEPTENLYVSTLTILTDEGDEFKVPAEGCHVGAGSCSRPLKHQPTFPHTKFALKHRLRDMAAVHVAFYYHPPMNRWTLVDHSPDPLGTLLMLKTGMAHPLSEGLRVKLGPITMEVVKSKGAC